MEFNIYSFLRIYTDISLQKASESEVNDMYNFLKDRTFGTDIEKSFTAENPLRLDKALAIDSVANNFSKQGNDLVQQVFPSAPYDVIEHTIENVSATMPWNEVAKLNQGYYSTVLDNDEGFIFLEKDAVGITDKEDIKDAIEEYEKLFKVDMASPGEILTLSRYYPKEKKYSIAVRKLEDKPMIVGGPASVEMVDKQGHLITSEALKVAFEAFNKSFRTRNINVLHSNVQCGWALPAYISEKGEIFKSGVDDKGLWLISELRNDISIANRVKDQIEEGRLRSYSIAGSATKTRNMQKAGQTIMQVDELQLAEVTLCEKGVNQGAYFDILKSETNTSSAELYSVGRSSSEKSDALKKFIPDRISIPDDIGIFIENSDKIIISADKSNSLTDFLQLEIQKSVGYEIPIEVRNYPLGEWERVMSIDISKQEGIPVAGRKASTWDNDIIEDGEKSGEIEVDKSYTQTEKLIGYMTIGIGQNRINVDDLNKGDNMDNLEKFLDWSKDEKARREEHSVLVSRPDLAMPQIDYDDSVDWEALSTEQSSDNAKDIKPKDLHKPSEG